MAREKRKYPIAYSEENVHKILSSLHLISEDGKVSNAALLLFAKDPQRWFVSATVKCVQFYGTKVQKPMAFQQMYGGSVFEMVDQAVSFVMSHIDARVGERTSSAQVDVEYELPMQAVTETIVNACVHRDFRSNGSVQVMLAGYIEQVGTGTNDVIDRCLELGLRKPEFRQDEDFSVVIWRRAGEPVGNVTGNETGNGTGNGTGNVTGNVKRIVLGIGGETLTREEIMQRLGLKGSGNFRAAYLYPAIEQGYVLKLYPESDKRRDQAYYLSEKGLRLFSTLKG